MKVARALLNLFVIVCLIVGVIAIVRWLLVLVHGLFSAVVLANAWHDLTQFFGAQAAIWLTAIATSFLWWATRALSRSTALQLKVDGPFIRVDLSLAPPPEAMFVPPYPANWSHDDRESPALAPYLGQERFVYLTVSNAQIKPVGVAGAVEIDVALYFGGTAPHHPNSIKRNVRVEVIGPYTFVTGPVLNVGQLPAFLVAVTRLEYRDLWGAKRNAGWGTNVIVEQGGSTVTSAKIFEPGKGEFI